MGFQISADILHLPSGNTHALQILSNDETGVRVAICPALGFNCISWQVFPHQEPQELLWSDFSGATPFQPTRCGIPILFPFPNRIRGGRFQWNGQSNQLPINDPQERNAIHGFACYQPWQVTDQGCEAGQAWLTGSFASSAPWPAAYELAVTYRITNAGLRLEFVVQNTDSVPLPFGIGLHPYFRVPTGEALLQLFARDVAEEGAVQWQRWVLEDCLPTGKRTPLDAHHVLLAGPLPAPLGNWHFDDAYHLTAGIESSLGGYLLHPTAGVGIELSTSPDFRDLVLFTPPHRQAVCIEPYTCATDAINLQQQGIDAGLKVLPPGESCEGWVAFGLMLCAPARVPKAPQLSTNGHARSHGERHGP